MNDDDALLFSAYLKDSFRDPIEYFQKGGLFVGRNLELSRLKSIVTNRGSATILLSGARGSGKTSLVRKAVSEAKENGIKAFPLVIDVPIISPSRTESASLENRRNILLTLVRSLYFAQEDNSDIKLKDKALLESLYKRTYLLEEKNSEAISSGSVQKVKEVQTTKRELKTTFEINNATLKVITNTLFGISVIPLIYVTNSVNNTVLKAVLLAGFGIAWLLSLFKFQLTNSKSNSDEQEETLNETLTDSSDTIIDLSDSYFETHLKRFLRNNSQTKFVFVFDELDKTLGISAQDIISCLKNLFTLSNGIYIFITAEDQYHALTNPSNASERGPEYTIFTDTIFLNQLSQDQVSTIVDQVIKKINFEQGGNTLDMIKHYLGWTSRNVAFDLFKKISDLADYGNEVALNVYDAHKVEADKQLNLDSDWKLCATFQAYVDAVFESHKHPWNNIYNAVLLDSLHAVASRLKDDEVLHIEDGDYWGMAEAELTSERVKSNIKLLDKKQRGNIGEACLDMLVGMEANDQFVFPPEQEGSEKTLNYYFNGGGFPSRRELEKLAYSRLPYEDELIAENRKLKSITANLRRAEIPIDEATTNLLGKAKIIENKINLTRRMRERSTIVVETTSLLQKTIDALGLPQISTFVLSLPGRLEGIGSLSPQGIHPSSRSRVGLHDEPLRTFFEVTLASLEATRHVIFHNEAGTNDQIVVVVIDLPIDAINELRPILRSRRSEIKTQIINLIYESEHTGRMPGTPGLRQFRVEQDFSNLTSVRREVERIVLSRLG